MSDSAGEVPPTPFHSQPPPGLPKAPGDTANAHAKLSAQMGALQKADRVLVETRKQLGRLAALGTTITTDDVVDSAARIVAEGDDAARIASDLADMPTNGGEALAQWVQTLLSKTAVQEQQLEQAMGIVAHQLGVAAIHALSHEDMMQQQGNRAKPNALMGDANGA